MDSKTQPILCCVGDAVAGRPTQFLMERAFAARNCDWRVITVEVRQENFQTALDGMRAMRFKALRFFPEFQLLAASSLLEPSAEPFHAVTSAMRQGDSWDCWDNHGFGLLDLIASASPASNVLIWLHGKSRLTYSLASAMRASEYSPGRLLWSDSSLAAGAKSLGSELTGRQLTGRQLTLADSELTLEDVEQSLRESLTAESTFTHLIVIGESLAEQLPLLSQLSAATETKLMLATNQMLTRQQTIEAWNGGAVSIVSEADQLLAAEAYDYRRWTGQPADMEMLRDAYDEYADF